MARRAVEKVIILEDEGLHDLKGDRFLFLDELYDLGRQHLAEHPKMFEAEIEKVQAGDTALLIYTSGTTGAPKGAMLSHENIMAAIEGGIRALPHGFQRRAAVLPAAVPYPRA